MLRSPSFRFRKTKNLPRDYPERKVTRMKLTNIFKSLRRRRLRRDISHRSPLTHSRSLPPPFADHHSSPAQPRSPELSTSPSLHVSCHRSDAVSILSATEKDCSSGMSTSSSDLRGTLPDVQSGRHFSPRPVPAFPTSPSVFQLRSASTRDYLVERLEQRLRRLTLGDTSPDRVALLQNTSRDIQMDVVCPPSPSASPHQRTIVPGTSSHSVLLGSGAVQEPRSLPHGQNAVPMILITSVDAKHAKPLPPSAQRPSRSPFGPYNRINYPTNAPSAKPERKTHSDDPFTTQPAHSSAYPPDYNLAFRTPPSFPSAYSSPTKHAPETPTPMCCDHFGDCKGDLWEILHPPLIAGTFTLPPFTLPPLSTGLFDAMSTPLPY